MWLRSARAMAPLLGYLRGLGVVPASGMAGPRSPADRLAGRFAEYLAGERGLAAASVRCYAGVARRFLAESGAGDGAGRLTAAEVTGFVRRECGRRSVASAKVTVTGLRSLLRFLYLDGQVTVPLAGVVPPVACWQLAALPRAVSPADLARIIGSCDRSGVPGRRDHAILLLLARLGLRSGEVAALDLADVNWRQGEVSIRGKGSRRDSLPLPADVGEAMAGWLAQGRPRDSGCPAVFTRLLPPHGRVTPASVGLVVRRACARAGVTPAGAHRLRHAAATQMLRSGGTLAEIGQVLRHARPGTTAVYAKADLAALAPLARPWPGGGQ
jgi:site-specific recombinase XerC